VPTAESNNNGSKHPRELIEEIIDIVDKDNRLDEDDQIADFYGKQGFDMNCSTTEAEETDGISSEEEERQEENMADQLALDEMDNYKALALRSPLEYFLNMRVKEAMQAIRMDQVREIDEEEPRQEEWETLKKYNDRMLHDGISPDDNSDPINYQRHAHDLSLIELKEGLTKAVTDRKAQALPLAISIFNRI